MYNCSEISKLIDRYMERGGHVEVLDEGVLGHGVLVLSAPRTKYAVVREVYVNPWVSTHTVRLYSKLPKKYQV